VPHLRDGFIVAKVGHRAEARSVFLRQSRDVLGHDDVAENFEVVALAREFDGVEESRDDVLPLDTRPVQPKV
jgi:hypothetical protein